MAARSLINLENASLDYGKGPVLDQVSLGLAVGARIGVVGRNGGGKSSLVRVMAGAEAPHSGRVSVSGGTRIGTLTQVDDLDPGATVRDIVMGKQADHEWAGDARVRDVLTGLFGGFGDTVLDRAIAPLSGGERRRGRSAPARRPRRTPQVCERAPSPSKSSTRGDCSSVGISVVCASFAIHSMAISIRLTWVSPRFSSCMFDKAMPKMALSARTTGR